MVADRRNFGSTNSATSQQNFRPSKRNGMHTSSQSPVNYNNNTNKEGIGSTDKMILAGESSLQIPGTFTNVRNSLENPSNN